VFLKGETSMRRRDVVLGQVYAVKVSGRIQPVRLIAESPYGGWVGRNEHTGREIRIRSAKLRAPGKARPALAAGSEGPQAHT
jgi:hypothetical protein